MRRRGRRESGRKRQGREGEGEGEAEAEGEGEERGEGLWKAVKGEGVACLPVVL
jgi:hypothetical protein